MSTVRRYKRSAVVHLQSNTTKFAVHAGTASRQQSRLERIIRLFFHFTAVLPSALLLIPTVTLWYVTPSARPHGITVNVVTITAVSPRLPHAVMETQRKAKLVNRLPRETTRIAEIPFGNPHSAYNNVRNKCAHSVEFLFRNVTENWWRADLPVIRSDFECPCFWVVPCTVCAA